MVDISDSVNSCCEQLAVKKELITTRRVQQELLAKGLLAKDEIISQAYKIPKLISTWRIIKLKTVQGQAMSKHSTTSPNATAQSMANAAKPEAVTQSTMAQAAVTADAMNIYKTLQIPEKVEQQDFMDMQRRIFILENELNRYKHATFRANSKVKCLEKKLYSFKGQLGRERQNIIDCLRHMLN